MPLFTEKLRAYGKSDFMLGWFVAGYYAMADEPDEAVNFLEHTNRMVLINYSFLSEIDPFFKNMHNNPRYQELMEKIKEEYENFKI